MCVWIFEAEFRVVLLKSSFLWGYILSSVVGGALVDRYGGKRVMAWGVALWSLATLLTPLAANHSTTTLLAVRAFFGLAEGVAMPSMTTLLSRSQPLKKKKTIFSNLIYHPHFNSPTLTLKFGCFVEPGGFPAMNEPVQLVCQWLVFILAML